MKAIRQTGTIILTLLIGSMLTAQESETPPVTLENVAPGVYQISGGKGSNGGAIIGENSVMLVDAKMSEESVKQSIDAIKRITEKPIKYLVNTHSDGDHIMGNRYFPASVTFIAHENCRDDFFKENYGRQSDWGESEFYPFTPSLTFQENLNVWLGKDKVELHYFGIGHTTGDAVVYFPEEKVAFIGDQYFNQRPQLIHSNKNGNSFQHLETLTKMLASLDAEIFLSGHSDPARREDIEAHIQSMIAMQMKVKELISQDKTMEEVLIAFDENESRLVTSIYKEVSAQ